MKREKTKSRKSKKVSKAAAAPPKPTKRGTNRRDFLFNSVFYTGAAAAVAGGGWYVFDSFAAEASESDLSTLGNGVPAVVQIHDPSCPTCNALRREAREAACSFDECELQFRVANLQTEAGRQLANRHGVGKITLLLFDESGSMRIALPGLQEAEDLEPVFRRHVARYAKKKPDA